MSWERQEALEHKLVVGGAEVVERVWALESPWRWVVHWEEASTLVHSDPCPDSAACFSFQ